MIAHLFRQGPAIGATLSLLASRKGQGAPQVPGPLLTETVPARDPTLVADFIRVAGGQPEAWKGHLPPTMFPQWGWPIITRSLKGLPYDLTRAVNAGCSWTVLAPLPDDQPLVLSARLASIDDDGRRALLTVELSTGTAAGEALRSTLTAFVPLPRKGEKGEKPAKSEPARVPEAAHQLARVSVPAGQGWDFCLVSGDFNPIHWLGPYARMAGFGGTILHGFGTAAIAAERLIALRHGGRTEALTGMELRFTRPLRLPAELGIFTGEPADGSLPLFAGAEPGAPAVLVGSVRG